MKKKIALIVQRYGLEVNGGAEHHCRLVAEKLCRLYDIEVFTSCALAYSKWANYYQEGVDEVNGVRVRRFMVSQERNSKRTRLLRKRLKRRELFGNLLKKVGLLKLAEQRLRSKNMEDEYEWVKNQGPYLPELIHYLFQHQNDFDALIFFTYLYYPTIYGLQINSPKSILIPTAHDEDAIYFSIFRKVFQLPKVILFNTESERNLVCKLFGNLTSANFVVGIGIDRLSISETEDQDMLSQYGLTNDSDYFVYIGRVDEWKGCKELNEYFLAYRKKKQNNKLKLVFIGQKYMPIVNDGGIIETGFIDDLIKNVILRNAKALIIPSRYESLSLVTLESMSCGVPVIANQHSEVLRNHMEKSNGGMLYKDYLTFEHALDQVLKNEDLRLTMGENAIAYVEKNYSWDVVLDKFQKAIALVAG